MSRLFVLLYLLVIAVSAQQESESSSHWGMVTCFLIVVLVLLSIVGLYCCKKWSVEPSEPNKAKDINRKTSPRKDNLLKRWYNTIDENKRKEALTINQKNFEDLPVTSARRTSLVKPRKTKSKSKSRSKSQHKKSKRRSSSSRNSKSSSSISHKSSQSIKSRDTTVTNKKVKSSKRKHERKKRSNNRSPR